MVNQVSWVIIIDLITSLCLSRTLSQIITEYSILFILNGVGTLVVHHGPTREVCSVFITGKAHWLSKFKKSKVDVLLWPPWLLWGPQRKVSSFKHGQIHVMNWFCLLKTGSGFEGLGITTPPKLSFSPSPPHPHPPLGAGGGIQCTPL